MDYGAVMGMGSGDQSGKEFTNFKNCLFVVDVVKTTTTTTTTTAAPTTRQDAMDYGAVMGMGSGDQSGKEFTNLQIAYLLLLLLLMSLQ